MFVQTIRNKVTFKMAKHDIKHVCLLVYGLHAITETYAAYSTIARSHRFAYTEDMSCSGIHQPEINSLTHMDCYEACLEQICSAMNYKDEICVMYFCKPMVVVADTGSVCYMAVDAVQIPCSKMI